MTPTQTTPPASPAPPVPTAGPTKEAIPPQWAQNAGSLLQHGDLRPWSDFNTDAKLIAIRCYEEWKLAMPDEIMALAERAVLSAAVVEAAERAISGFDPKRGLILKRGDEFCDDMQALQQSLTACARAAGKGQQT